MDDELPFFGDDSLRRQPQYVKSAIAHEAEVRSRGDGYARVKEGGVLYGIAIESLCAIFEHCWCNIM